MLGWKWKKPTWEIIGLQLRQKTIEGRDSVSGLRMFYVSHESEEAKAGPSAEPPVNVF